MGYQVSGLLVLLAFVLNVANGQTTQPSTQPTVLPGVWVEVDAGAPRAKSDSASGGAFIMTAKNTRSLTLQAQMPARCAKAMVFLRWAGVGGTARPVTVALGDRAVELQVGGYTGGKTGFRWAMAPVTEVPAGRLEITISLPADLGQTSLDVLGIVPDDTHGLWRPPLKVNGGVWADGGATLPAVELLDVTPPVVGGLLLDREYLRPQPRPIAYTLKLRNNMPVEAARGHVTGSIENEQGPIGELAAHEIALAPGLTQEVTVNVPPPSYGWYRLRLQGEVGGVKIAHQSTFCMLRSPAEGVREKSMFGLGLGEKPEDMEIARRIGAKWRRGIPGAHPNNIAPAPGQWWKADRIEAARKTVEAWREHGVMCLGYVDYNAKWNVKGDPLGRPIAPHQNRPKDLKAQAEIVYHLIQPLSDLVRYWEIWNEPWVHGWTWRTGEAQDYRDMTRLIWDRVKPEMPDVQIIGGGSTPYQRDVVYAKGSKNTGYIDGTSTHPYGRPDRSMPSVTALEAIMNRDGSQGGGKGGIWATEVGTAEFMYDDYPIEERPFMVARSVAPIYLMLRLGAGETPLRTFFFASKYNARFSGQEHNWWAGKNPRPAVAAYSAMTHFLEDATFVEDVYASSKAMFAMLFTRAGGENVVAVFSDEGFNGEIRLPAGDLLAFDYLARPIGNRRGDELVVPIRAYEVRYITSKLPLPKLKDLLRQVQIDSMPSLSVNLRSFDRPLDQRPSLRIKLENLLPREASGELTITPPSSIKLAQTQLKIDPMRVGEIRIIEIPITHAQADPLNRYAFAYESRFNDAAQSGKQVIQVAAAKFGTVAVDGDLSDFADSIPMTMVSQGGKDYTEIALNPDRARELMDNPGGQGPAIYRLRTKWDQDHLYLAAEVPDATLTTNSTFEDDPYSFAALVDCVQFAMDVTTENPDDLLRGSSIYEKCGGSEVDYEFAATPARKTGTGPHFSGKPPFSGDLSTLPLTPQVHRLKAPGTNFQTYYPGNAPLTPALGTMKEVKSSIAYDAQRQILTYEIAIPWSAIPELKKQLDDAKSVTRVGFNWAVHDAKGRGRTFWSLEAGDVQPGAYGFSPHWGGGDRRFGGRVTCDWGFYR